VHSLKESSGIGDHWHPAHRPILRAGFRIAAQDDFTGCKVQVAPAHRCRFAFTAIRERQAPQEIGAIV